MFVNNYIKNVDVVSLGTHIYNGGQAEETSTNAFSVLENNT